MNIKFLMVMCMALLLVGSVSAMEIDNTYEYNSVTREATFYNTFLGIKTSEIGTARLNTPLNVKVAQGYQKVAEFNIRAYGDYNDAIKQFTFTDQKTKTKINRDYDLKVLSYESVEIPDYKKELTGYTINGTAIYENILSGTHSELKEVWKKVTPADLKKNEELTIGVFTEVQKGDFVDWIPVIYGEEVVEWATWTEDLNTGLLTYYKLDEASGTTAVDSTGTSDGTNTGALVNQAGILGTSYDFDDYSADRVDTGFIPNGTSFSIQAWVYPTASTASRAWRIVNSQSGQNGVDLDYTTFDGGVIQFNKGTGSTTDYIRTDYKLSDNLNSWTHIVGVFDGTNMKIYINGVENQTAVKSNAVSWGASNLFIGNRPEADRGFEGKIDEVGIWNRALTPTEVTQLYNGGTGITYTDTFGSNPYIILNSPTSTNYTTSPQSLEINFTAWDGENLTDVKVYVNDILNQTNATGLNNTNYIFPLTLGDGEYEIYGKATDSESNEYNSDTINIIIDSIAPTINITSPITTETTSELPQNSTLNVTVSDSNLGACWYHTSDNATNITYTCNTTTNISFNTGGYKTIYAFVNDTLGNENTTSITYLINYIEESATYDETVIEQENHTLILNITASEITSFNATLNYNGTEYTPTIVTTGNTSIVTTELTAPPVISNQQIIFNWTYTLNGVDYNSSTYNQTILFLTELNITSADCVDKTLRFQLQDEGNLSALTGDIEYNFNYGISNGSLKNIYGSLTGVNTFYFCINATVSENYTIGYGEIQYRDANYVDRRYYLFEGRVISNNTLTNISLRDLRSVEQTSFLLTMEDTSLNPYANRYTALWRWYPDLNEYQIVEMGKTDNDGQTVAHVQTEDVDYRVGLYETDGTLIKLDDPRRFVCTSSPCSLTIRVGATDADYSSIFDIQEELTYDQTTKLFTFIYNDPNQYTSSMRLLVTRETGTDTLIICNSTSSGFTGVMVCNTSAYTGLKKAVVYRSASPPVIIAQKVVSELNTTFNSGFGLFISVMLWLAIVLSGFGNNPVFILILTVIGLIPALIFGSINIAIFTGIAVLASITIHFIKRAVVK